MTYDRRRAVALWRYAVLGHLVSVRREHGDLAELLREAAALEYERPDGKKVRIARRTIEDWFYRYRQHGLDGLLPAVRSDEGASRRIDAELGELLALLKKENPRRSIRRIIAMAERAGKVVPGLLKRSTVHRLLAQRGLSGRCAASPERERRAFRHAFAGDCYMGDVMYGPLVKNERGKVVMSYLHLLIDSATRFVPGAAFKLTEQAKDHEAVLKQAVLTYGVPRMLYLDNGSAQVAHSLAEICAELGIRLVHTRPYDPAAKGAAERIFRTLRAQLLSELPEQPLGLDELNSHLWNYLAVEYHKVVHSATGRSPLDLFLEHAPQRRRLPLGLDLDRIFLHRTTRTVRKDGTVSLGGRCLEVVGTLAGKKIELRYDPHDPLRCPMVFTDGAFVCDTRVLDLVANASGRRKRPVPPVPDRPSGISPLEQTSDLALHRPTTKKES